MEKRTNRYKITLFSLAVLFVILMPWNIKASQEAMTQKTTFPVQVIQKTGDDNENFVILIMGDAIPLISRISFWQMRQERHREC